LLGGKKGGCVIVRDPIIISSPPRSGTTMLVGLLHKHGLWVGTAGITPYAQTNSLFGSENIEIKNLMKGLAKSIGYKNWNIPLPQLDSVGERAYITYNRISEIVPEQTPWLVKTAWTLIFGELWMKMFPEAKWLFVVRPIEDVIDSVKRHPAMKKRNISVVRKFIEALQDKQHFLSEQSINYLFVDANKIVEGDLIACEKLFSFCELDFDPIIFKGWIKPSMWHKDMKIC